MTLALTGVGVAYFDDIRIEPLISSPASAPDDLPAAEYRSVFPAGGVPKK